MRRVLAVPQSAWLALALALRAAFVLKVGSRLIQIDENAFNEAARSLVSTGTLGTSHVPPVAAAFFAVWFLPGMHLTLARLGQALVSTATVWALGRATEEATGSESAGRLAVIVAAIYPFFVYYSAALLAETIYIACLTLGVWQLIRSVKGGGRGADAAAGAWLALAGLTRPEGAYVWAVIWALGLTLCARGLWPVRAWALTVLCWALPLLGWCAHNRSTLGRFALDVHGGVTLLHGTMFFEQNEQDTAVAMEAMEKEPWYREAETLPPVERDEALRRRAFAFMREHPAATLGQWARKFVSFWRFYPRTDKSFIENRFSHPAAGASRKLLVAASLAFEPWLIVLGWLGLIGLARREPASWPIPLFVLGTMAVHVLSVSQMRYRLPAMPWLILGACRLISESDSFRSLSRDAASSPAGSKR